jgi:serine/threonine-protein kinase
VSTRDTDLELPTDLLADAPVAEEEFTATWISHGVQPGLLVTGTLRPPPVDESTELPALTSTLTFVDELGRGGQAIVELARQDPLGREVAVKRPLGDAEDEASARSTLLVEGKICSQLDHPNIIPVYDLGLDDDGQVVLVMKRVRGEVWTHKLRDANVPRAYHLGVLQEVCKAVHFAHSHGVLHRDLKPSNVMIDESGQVYVVDWGIAVALDDRAPDGVPRQRRSRGVVGTISYMAPEMAWPGARLDERADVFLLGSILYRLCAGRAPNRGEDAFDKLKAAYRCDPPPLPDDTPEELVAICEKARHRELDRRYPTAEALREALVAFDQHASSRALAVEGEARLKELRSLSATAEDDPAAARRYTEARFAFAQALHAWPESEQAYAGAQAALQVMTRRELDRGRPGSAERLAQELDAPMEDVERALEVTRQEQAALREAAARAEELERQSNFRIGRRTRGLFLLAIAVLWACFQAVTGAGVRGGWLSLTSRDLALNNLGLLVLSTIAFAVFRRRVAENKAGRRVVLVLLAGVAAITAQWALLAALGVEPGPGMALIHVVIAAGFFWLAAEDRMWTLAAVFTAASVAVIYAWPAAALELNGAVVSVAFLSAAWPSLKRRPQA